eukprot:TRINITY_DN2541_c0_g1_i2.p1 TRINITY_DN2541_c0_g1~~TRINITY_DN2541_c0_g1_i2.p1  ORF type:complete len:982 (+),score=320.55 TRINITY_DN2541_c0_g1_i2:98-3043(+)
MEEGKSTPNDSLHLYGEARKPQEIRVSDDSTPSMNIKQTARKWTSPPSTPPPPAPFIFNPEEATSSFVPSEEIGSFHFGTSDSDSGTNSSTARHYVVPKAKSPMKGAKGSPSKPGKSSASTVINFSNPLLSSGQDDASAFVAHPERSKVRAPRSVHATNPSNLTPNSVPLATDTKVSMTASPITSPRTDPSKFAIPSASSSTSIRTASSNPPSTIQRALFPASSPPAKSDPTLPSFNPSHATEFSVEIPVNVKRSKRKKDQAFYSLDQEDTSGYLEPDTNIDGSPVKGASSNPGYVATVTGNSKTQLRLETGRSVHRAAVKTVVPPMAFPRGAVISSQKLPTGKFNMSNRVKEVHDDYSGTDSDSCDDDESVPDLVGTENSQIRKLPHKLNPSLNFAKTASKSLRAYIDPRRRSGKEWEEKEKEEREKIKEFWLSLTDSQRRELVKLEKEAVLKKMKEQQKHTCSCSVCGRRRTVIEEELEMLYDAYYEELEHYEDERKNTSNIDVQDEGGILTVADDLLKNEGKKFLEMMERLAERRVRREQEDVDEETDEEYEEEYEEEDEEEQMTEEQRLEEGRRMFQMFAAKMFEQRVLSAYREKVALENQRKLLEEEEELELQEALKKEAKTRKAKQKKERKKQAKQLADQKKKEKEEEDARKAEENRKIQDEIKKKKEQERKIKLAEEEAIRNQLEQLKFQEEKKKREEKRKKEEEKRKREKEEKMLLANTVASSNPEDAKKTKKKKRNRKKSGNVVGDNPPTEVHVSKTPIAILTRPRQDEKVVDAYPPLHATLPMNHRVGGTSPHSSFKLKNSTRPEDYETDEDADIGQLLKNLQFESKELEPSDADDFGNPISSIGSRCIYCGSKVDSHDVCETCQNVNLVPSIDTISHPSTSISNANWHPIDTHVAPAWNPNPGSFVDPHRHAFENGSYGVHSNMGMWSPNMNGGYHVPYQPFAPTWGQYSFPTHASSQDVNDFLGHRQPQ